MDGARQREDGVAPELAEGRVEWVPVGRRNSQVIKTSFPHLLAGAEGKKRIEAIIPTYGTDYRKPENAARFNALAIQARKQLRLI